MDFLNILFCKIVPLNKSDFMEYNFTARTTTSKQLNKTNGNQGRTFGND